MPSKPKPVPDTIAPDIVFDEGRHQWVAKWQSWNAPGKSHTNAALNLRLMLQRETGKEVEVKDSVLHIPAPLKSRYTQYKKDLERFFNARREYEERLNKITDDRIALAQELHNRYGLSIIAIAPLLGLSQQRLGKLMAEANLGIRKPMAVDDE